jgi:NAD(P)-dependent dehydrogenase (short-subunit alcohol dehydrogenase family)
MDFANKTVVVTGGTGALGTAVVDSLLQQGAHCVVPYVHEAEMARFAHRDHKSLTLIAVRDLADEADVARLYAQADSLWASIHIAGGFAMGKVADTDKAALLAQIDQNLVSCFLCCRAAVKAFGANGGRIVNGAASAGMARGRRHERLCHRQGRRRRADHDACRGGCEGRRPGQRCGAIDHGHGGQPRGHAEGESRVVAEGGGGCGDHRVPRLARQPGHARRHRAGVRQSVSDAPVTEKSSRTVLSPVILRRSRASARASQDL